MAEISKTNSNVTTLLIPNYNQLFRNFCNDFSLLATNIPDMPVENHLEIHSILSSLNIALHSTTTNEEIRELQNRLQKVIEMSSQSLQRKQKVRQVCQDWSNF